MTNHTPGRIEATHNTGPNMQGYQQSSALHGTGENRLELIAGCFKDIGGEEVAAANARRLAACWNAFDAPCMTTPMIEYLIGIGGVNTLSNQADAMLKEADAARALLEDIARHPFVTADLSKSIRDFLKGADSSVNAMPDGWAMSTADFSVIASGGSNPGSVTLVRTGEDRKNWHAFADADSIPLYACGRGMTFDEAMRDAISEARNAPPVPVGRP